MVSKSVPMLIALLGLVGVALGSDFYCSNSVKCEAKANAPNILAVNDHAECTAVWGAFNNSELIEEANKLIVHQLKSSLEYLLVASHFKEWKANRPGFAGYFSKLSDSHWDEAISLLIQVIERGGTLVKDKFKVDMPASTDPAAKSYQLKEMDALSFALDKERKTALETLHLAHLANHRPGVPHDAVFADWLAEHLQHNYVLRIKHLANNVNLLSDIVRDPKVDSSYALFKFDAEYLK